MFARSVDGLRFVGNRLKRTTDLKLSQREMREQSAKMKVKSGKFLILIKKPYLCKK